MFAFRLEIERKGAGFTEALTGDLLPQALARISAAMWPEDGDKQVRFEINGVEAFNEAVNGHSPPVGSKGGGL